MLHIYSAQKLLRAALIMVTGNGKETSVIDLLSDDIGIMRCFSFESAVVGPEINGG